jgi:hypothetical protein
MTETDPLPLPARESAECVSAVAIAASTGLKKRPICKLNVRVGQPVKLAEGREASVSLTPFDDGGTGEPK